MRATARLHHPTVPFDRTLPTHLVVSVTGDEGDRLRPSLGLVFVLDRSGSMVGDKLQTVTSALRHLTNYLDDSDHLALVTFDDEVKVAFESSAATPQHLARFTSVLGDVVPGGTTNLDQAVTTGIALANEMARRAPERVVRVVVLTDGQANAGETSARVIAGRIESAGSNVSLSTIGVGYDCDHALLGQLAERGGGSYGFVESPSQAAEVLGAEIGGLVNLDAVRLALRVRAQDKYISLGAPLGVRGVDEQGTWLLELGNLVAGQTRHVVFPLTTHAAKRAFARPVTVADVEVRAVVEGEPVVIGLKPKVHFTASDHPERDEALDEVVDLAVLGVAQRAAERLAERRDYQGAAKSLAGQVFFTASVSVLAQNTSENYSSQQKYASSTVNRTSMSSMLSVTSSLTGSSSEFDALVSRTIGSYLPDAARQVAMDTSAAVGPIPPNKFVTVAGQSSGPTDFSVWQREVEIGDGSGIFTKWPLSSSSTALGESRVVGNDTDPGDEDDDGGSSVAVAPTGPTPPAPQGVSADAE